MASDVCGFVREIIGQQLEEKEEFPKMREIKKKVKEEFDYKISTLEVMDCLGF